MSLDLPRIKALCFDVDGTLSDTDDLYAQKAVLLFPRFLFNDPRPYCASFHYDVD
jgi:beta-phosphoglucomutase-like phosphatase (HAD superfamily)